jgi:CSLREA domain-containing protein
MNRTFRRSPLVVAISSVLAASGVQAATITVNSLADPGGSEQCSLRHAIESVNTQAPVYGCAAPDGVDDTIVFDNGLTGTIELSAGQLTVYSNLSIVGPGAEDLVIQASPYSRVLEVTDSIQASVSGLTLTGGSANYGAGLYVSYSSTVSLSDCVISGNYASEYGGGIEVFEGELAISNCEIRDNISGVYGGGLSVTRGVAYVSDSSFADNAADSVGGGIWVAPQTVYGGVIPTNVSGHRRIGRELTQGLNYQPAMLVLESSTVSGNSSPFGGGIGAGNEPYKYSPESAPANSNIQGGPLPDLSNIVVVESTISGNLALFGGGLGLVGGSAGYGPEGEGGYGPVNVNTLLVEDSQISSNLAYVGGGLGVKYGNSSLFDTLVSNNTTAYLGGGIANIGPTMLGPLQGDDINPRGRPAFGDLLVFYSTISDNQVTGAPFEDPEGTAGGSGPAVGGGVFQVYGTGVFHATEISGNASQEVGGGVFSASSYSVFSESQLSGNVGGGGFAYRYGAFISVRSRLENNHGGLVGGLACEYGTICQLDSSSVTGNEGELVGGLAGELSIGLYSGETTPDVAGFDSRGGQMTLLGVFNSTISSNAGGLAGGILAPVVFLSYSTLAFNSQQEQPLAARGYGFPLAGGMGTTDSSIVVNSIVANNASADGPADLNTNNESITLNYSLVEDTQGFVANGSGNLFEQDPQLDALDFNGSVFTLTHALMPGSPAIDAGDPDSSAAPDYDQRGPGFDRVVDGRVDMGAYEFSTPPPEPGISLSHSEIDFGDVLVGTNTVVELTVYSVGDAPLELDSLGLGFGVVVAGISLDGFALDNDTCSNQTLQPTESCTVDVVFEPEARDVYAAIVIVPSNADDNGPETVSLSGNGVAPELSIDPDLIDFGTIDMGSTSGIETVELTNTGNAVLNLNSLSGLALPFAANGGTCTIPGSLDIDESCTLGFDFSPDMESLVSQLITVDSDSLGGDSSFTLQGTGAEPEEPAISLSTLSVDFGNVLVGTDSDAQVTIESAGTGNLEIGQIDFGPIPAGGPMGPFEIFADSCSNQTLAPTEDCTFSVSFQPPGRGVFDAMISVPSNAPDSPAEVGVTGVGVAPELSINPDLIDFGTVNIGSTSGVESVELTNTGDAVLNLNSLGGLALPFAANGGTCTIPGSLAIDESCTLGFDFSPDTEGFVAQLITGDSDSLGGDSSFTLQGTGSDEPVEPPAAPIPVPVMSRVGIALLGGGLMLLGWLGLRRRIG